MADRIQEILSELREAIKAEVREEVRAELIAELGGARTQPKAKGKPGPKPKAAGKAKAKAGTSAPATLKVTAGKRRTPEEVEQAGEVLKKWFGKNPGSRIDQAAKALGVSVKDLQLPVQALLTARALTKKGRLRGTTYTVKG